MSQLLNDDGQTYAEIIDADDCTGCALCCQMCPDVAIRIDSDRSAAKKKESGASVE
jgi:NAD-dependent dihydropyrimidine dehydrogenase PreA subunit